MTFEEGMVFEDVLDVTKRREEEEEEEGVFLFVCF